MPKETIRVLSEDVERVLIAGAHLAAGDDALTRDQAALEALSKKLGAKAPPVFGKLVEQIDKAQHAPAKSQPAELVTLAALVGQVRAAQASLAVAPAETTPIARVPEIGTPCNARELYEVHDALIKSGKGRQEIIDGAVERGDVADLRLVRAVVQAMGDSYIGAKVCDDVVPAFGRAVVEPIREKLKFPGKAADGRRLRALVAVEKEGCHDIVAEALKVGSAEMREAALDALADHVPGVASLEPLVLGILATEKAAGVRRAAVRALKGYGDDAAFEALMAALVDERTMNEAGEALGTSRHRGVVDRLLPILEENVAAAKKRTKADDKAGTAKKALAKRLLTAIMRAFAEIDDPRISQVALGLVDDLGSIAARAAIKSATKAELQSLAKLVDGDDPDLLDAGVLALRKLGDDAWLSALTKAFRDPGRELPQGLRRLQAFSSQSDEALLKRAVPVLIDAVGKPWRPVGAMALRMLAVARDPSAVEPILAAIAGNRREDNFNYAALQALQAIGDKRALPALLARLNGLYSWQVGSAIRQLADESTVAVVRDLLASMKEAELARNWGLKHLMRSLEKKFPGA